MRSFRFRSFTLAAYAVAVAFVFAGSAGAQQSKRPAPRYVVLHEHAFIPFSRQIESWDVVGDDTVLVRTIYDRWYRATTNRVCASELRSATRIALIDRGAGIDTGARIRVNGMSCFLSSIDEIQNPYRNVVSR